jgi:hypothetical protein
MSQWLIEMFNNIWGHGFISNFKLSSLTDVAFTEAWHTARNLLASVLPPSTGFPAGIQQSIMTIVTFGLQLGFIIPWNALFLALGIIISLSFARLMFKVTKWLLEYIRGK